MNAPKFGWLVSLVLSSSFFAPIFGASRIPTGLRSKRRGCAFLGILPRLSVTFSTRSTPRRQRPTRRHCRDRVWPLRHRPFTLTNSARSTE